MSETLNIKPLSDRVLVERAEFNTSPGGIVIPDNAQEKAQEGFVRAIGPGKIEDGKLNPVSVNVGDKIIFGKYSGSEVKLEGKEYVVMREDDIIGIVQ